MSKGDLKAFIDISISLSFALGVIAFTHVFAFDLLTKTLGFSSLSVIALIVGFDVIVIFWAWVSEPETPTPPANITPKKATVMAGTCNDCGATLDDTDAVICKACMAKVFVSVGDDGELIMEVRDE